MRNVVKTMGQYSSVLTGVTALMVTSQALGVTLSSEEFTEYASEEAYWVVSVNCDDGSDPRIIQRKTDGNQWCGKEVEGYCFNAKAETAEKVCSADYSDSLATAKRAEQERERQEQANRQAEQERRQAQAQAALAQQQAAEAERQKQIDIDEQLLQIEQEKLSLRRQELELQRRAVEIREALESLDNSSP